MRHWTAEHRMLTLTKCRSHDWEGLGPSHKVPALLLLTGIQNEAHWKVMNGKVSFRFAFRTTLGHFLLVPLFLPGFKSRLQSEVINTQIYWASTFTPPFWLTSYSWGWWRWGVQPGPSSFFHLCGKTLAQQRVSITA